jgi:signal transduction histidine kinase
MGRGIAPARQGRLATAVAWVAVANWAVAIVATAIAPFCLPVTIVAAILPVALAVPYVGSTGLARVCAGSLIAGTVTVLAGTVQDFSGFGDGLPAWLRTGVVVVFVPFVFGLVVVIGATNHRRLTRMLETVLAANHRLRRTDDELRRSRARLVAAAERERRSIGRDLHDGAQQRLIAVGMGLACTRALIVRRPAEAAAAMARLEDDVRAALAELRRLSHGLHPSHLADFGLTVALADAAERLGRPCRARLGALGRYPTEVEAAVYFSCAEALQNASKHAGPLATVELVVEVLTNGDVLFEVSDDGVGFDPALVPAGRGLTNLADRVGAAGGELLVSSEVGRGTRVRGRVPCPQPAGDSPARSGNEASVIEGRAPATRSTP